MQSTPGQEGQEMSAAEIDPETNPRKAGDGGGWMLASPQGDDLTTHLIARMGNLEFGMGRMIGSIERLNDRIDSQVERLNDRIHSQVASLSERIDTQVASLSERIDTQVARLSERVDAQVARLSERFDTQVEHLNDRIDAQGERLDKRIAVLGGQVQELASEVQKVCVAVNDLNTWKHKVWGICVAVSGIVSIASALGALFQALAKTP
ncbi:hypothetical protein [Pinirhizobacter sp.]|jgi:phage host-nuclease inhibitor protein Gam|uniref:hypothetical protein n=1 Tax=Pinirhizobacter sp. TaxID=2950432 RepID=UPI002F3FF297